MILRAPNAPRNYHPSPCEQGLRWASGSRLVPNKQEIPLQGRIHRELSLPFQVDVHMYTKPVPTPKMLHVLPSYSKILALFRCSNYPHVISFGDLERLRLHDTSTRLWYPFLFRARTFGTSVKYHYLQRIVRDNNDTNTWPKLG